MLDLIEKFTFKTSQGLIEARLSSDKTVYGLFGPFPKSFRGTISVKTMAENLEKGLFIMQTDLWKKRVERMINA
jgi:hypothetical protein